MRARWLASAILMTACLAGCKAKQEAPAAAPVAPVSVAAPVSAPVPVVDDPTAFKITGPTLIAFFPMTKAEMAAGGGEALSDFQYYLFLMKAPMHDAGIRLEQTNESSFPVLVDGKITTYTAKPKSYGYYWIEPGKAPRVETSMMTQLDCVQIAKEYFGIDVALPKE